MSFKIQQAVKNYYDSLIFNNIKEKNVESTTLKKQILIIKTSKKEILLKL